MKLLFLICVFALGCRSNPSIVYIEVNGQPGPPYKDSLKDANVKMAWDAKCFKWVLIK